MLVCVEMAERKRKRRDDKKVNFGLDIVVRDLCAETRIQRPRTIYDVNLSLRRPERRPLVSLSDADWGGIIQNPFYRFQVEHGVPIKEYEENFRRVLRVQEAWARLYNACVVSMTSVAFLHTRASPISNRSFLALQQLRDFANRDAPTAAEPKRNLMFVTPEAIKALSDLLHILLVENGPTKYVELCAPIAVCVDEMATMLPGVATIL